MPVAVKSLKMSHSMYLLVRMVTLFFQASSSDSWDVTISYRRGAVHIII